MTYAKLFISFWSVRTKNIKTMAILMKGFLNAALILTAVSTANAFSVLPKTQLKVGSTQMPSRLVVFSTTEDKKVSEEVEMEPLGKPGTAEMEVPWGELGFSFRPVKSHLRMTYKDGEWGEPELVEVSNNVIHHAIFLA